MLYIFFLCGIFVQGGTLNKEMEEFIMETFELSCKMLELAASSAAAYHAAFLYSQNGNFDRSEKLDRAGNEFWLASAMARDLIGKVGTEEGYNPIWMYEREGRAQKAVRSAYGLGW